MKGITMPDSIPNDFKNRSFIRALKKTVLWEKERETMISRNR